ncbi:MAG TPA: vitamin K epoxide reductase family protein [Gemmatimonadales bacterium]|jgi:uncharacterized membrane protein
MTNPLRYRMAIAVLALVAGLVALYLHLWKLGLVGSIACTANRGCEVAMTSAWGWFLGVDVALIGVLGYAAILGVALWGAQPSRAWSAAPTLALLALVVPAVLFTVRLKWAEWVVLKTFCPWCLESAVTIVACLVLALLDLRRVLAPEYPPQ